MSDGDRWCIIHDTRGILSRRSFRGTAVRSTLHCPVLRPALSIVPAGSPTNGRPDAYPSSGCNADPGVSTLQGYVPPIRTRCVNESRSYLASREGCGERSEPHPCFSRDDFWCGSRSSPHPGAFASFTSVTVQWPSTLLDASGQLSFFFRRVCATPSFQHELASPGSLTGVGAEILRALSNVPACSARSVVCVVSVGRLASDMDKKPPLTVAQMTALIACILVGVFGLTRFGAGGPYTFHLSWVPIILGCFGAALGIMRRDVQRGLRLAVVVGVVLFVLGVLAIAAVLFSGKGWQS